MKIRIMSDLHIEFERRDREGNPGGFFITPMVGDDETVLVLAGDIGLVKNPKTITNLIEEACDRFYAVIYVLGNHEYYYGSLVRSLPKIKDALGHTSVHILENDKVKIDDVTFLGSTMWSNYDNGNPLSIMEAEASLNDFKQIRTGMSKTPYKRPVRAPDFHSRFLNAEAYLNGELYNTVMRDGEKCVVVTHHAPSFMSVHPQFVGSRINGAYASELGNMIAAHGPNLWVHGHMHDSADYEICNTRIVCNPRGYAPNDLNPEFNVCLVINV